MKPTFFVLFMLTFVTWSCNKVDSAAVSATVASFDPASGVDSTLSLFQDINRVADSGLRTQLLDSVWKKLSAADQIPLKSGKEVLFLYRGTAHNVHFNGAFNKWGKGPEVKGQLLKNLGLWYATARMPETARLEYKITLNTTNWLTQFLGWKTEWIMDPANPHRRPGGFGEDSELIMPGYTAHPETVERADVVKGTLSAPEQITSLKLGYPVRFRVYTPAGYESLNKLPSVYVTDGHEYADPNMGRMTTVLDNAISDGSIKPVVAIFIDPRDVQSGENLRMTEFALNENFAAFIAEELVLLVDARYKTVRNPTYRAIMGTSLGGLNAAWVGYKYPSVFGNLAIHSPAFWYRQAILEHYKTSETLPLNIYLATGTVNDAEEHARLMHDILVAKGYNVNYSEHAESHSWGLWQGLIDEPLQFFWGRKAITL